MNLDSTRVGHKLLRSEIGSSGCVSKVKIDCELRRYQEEALSPSFTDITLWRLREGQFNELSHGLNTNHSQHRDHVGAMELK